jgi:hypothetical protein
VRGKILLRDFADNVPGIYSSVFHSRILLFSAFFFLEAVFSWDQLVALGFRKK